MSGFEEFPKIARLSRGCVVTEKIDGTNGQVFIVPAVDLTTCGIDSSYVLATHEDGSAMFAGSRSRLIVPAADNAGFAAWVKANVSDLWKLGPGRHFGEWWGSGIQRGYGLQKGLKRFSLFNVARWSDSSLRPNCCLVVPMLYAGPFDTARIEATLTLLGATGSQAEPGFMRPEGVVIWHEAARQLFKKTLEKDDAPKGAQ